MNFSYRAPKLLILIVAAILSVGFNSSVNADVKFKQAKKQQKQHQHVNKKNRASSHSSNKRGRYGQKHYDYSRDPLYRSHREYRNNRQYRNNRHYRNDRRRSNRSRYERDNYHRGYYTRPVLTNCRYLYNRYGERVKRCYPPRYRYSHYDQGKHHGHRFHNRYGAYYQSYGNGRYHRQHRGHHRSGHYYDRKVGEWVALAILFDRLLD